jgi:hypothetical protein
MGFPGGCDERAESRLQAVPLTGRQNSRTSTTWIGIDVTGVDRARPGRRRLPARDLQAMPAQS